MSKKEVEKIRALIDLAISSAERHLRRLRYIRSKVEEMAELMYDEELEEEYYEE